MKKIQTKKIDGIEFTVQQMPAMQGLRFMAKLGAKLGPAFGAIGGMLKHSDGGIGNMPVEALGAVIAAGLASISPDDAEQITRELLELTSAVENGKAVDVPSAFDEFFQGRLPLIFKVLGFSLEVNYGGFFGIARALAKSSATGEASISA